MSALLALVLTQAPLVVETKCPGFVVRFTSPSGVPAEDDGRVDLIIDGTTVPVPFKPAMFTSTNVASEDPSVRCRDGLLAWEVRPKVLLLLVSLSGRPSLDFVSVALVDLGRKKVLQVLEGPWQLASGRAQTPQGLEFSFVVRRAAGGLDLRVVREWISDDPTGAIEDWLAIRVKGERVSARWLRP